MDKFQNKYRIPSARLQNWDYRWAGAYFITLCTHHRQHFFGEIANGKMQLSEIGKIANELWYQIPHHAKNVELGAFVIMPNHIHGIIIITNGNNDKITITNPVVESLHARSRRIQRPTDTSQKRPNVEYFAKIKFDFRHCRSLQSPVPNMPPFGVCISMAIRFYDHIIRKMILSK
jgi:REP element-mobilizing transposase RayT